MSSSSYMSTAVMSQPFTVTSHHSNPAASSNQSSITTPAGTYFQLPIYFLNFQTFFIF